MLTISELIDATNYDWQTVGQNEYAWFEEDYDMGVRVIARKGKSNANLVIVKNAQEDWEIELRNDWEKWIMVALEYCQFGPHEDWQRGTPEHFWAMAKAIMMFGKHEAFGGTKDGIYAYVGPRMVFMEYVNGRYDLFDAGCHAYAGTPAGVLKAYEKLCAEIDLWGSINPTDANDLASNRNSVR